MSINRWRGDAQAIAQVVTLTPVNPQVGDQFQILVNGKTVSFTVTVATAANVTAGLTAAWAAAGVTIPEVAEEAAADLTGTMTLTANTPGTPFTLTTNVIQAGGSHGAALNQATTVANQGPNCWGTAGNWSLGAVPVTGDDVVLEASNSPILYDLDQSGVTLNSLSVQQTYTGSIGLPRVNTSGAASYVEYRPDYLKIGATTVTISGSKGQGAGRIKLDTLGIQTAIDIVGTGNPLDQGLPAMLWKTTGAAGGLANTCTISEGSLGIAYFAGEVAVCSLLSVGFQQNVQGDATVIGGGGLTLTTLDQMGGAVALAGSVTTVNKTDGDLAMAPGAATCATLSSDAGTVEWQSAGSVGTLNVGNKCKVDFSLNMQARHVLHCNLYAGGTITDPFGTVTWDNGINLIRTSLADVTLDLGTHQKISVGVVS